MNYRLVSVPLIVLLLGSLGFGVYEWNQNQRLTQENQQLKQQLDTTAEQLQAAQNEQTRLNNELSQSNTKITELDAKITTLEQNITALEANITQLRKELKLRDYTTIALTFLWSPRIKEPPQWTNRTSLPALVEDAVQSMNNNRDTWDAAHIYFWIRYAGPEKFIPDTGDCGFTVDTFKQWGHHAWILYTGSDIPIGIFSGLKKAIRPPAGCAAAYNGEYAISVKWDSFEKMHSLLLTHEICHVLGFSEAEINIVDPTGYGDILQFPSEWIDRIKAAARQFQMPLPDDYAPF